MSVEPAFLGPGVTDVLSLDDVGTSRLGSAYGLTTLLEHLRDGRGGRGYRVVHRAGGRGDALGLVSITDVRMKSRSDGSARLSAEAYVITSCERVDHRTVRITVCGSTGVVMTEVIYGSNSDRIARDFGRQMLCDSCGISTDNISALEFLEDAVDDLTTLTPDSPEVLLALSIHPNP